MLFNILYGLFSNDMAIDLGTANIIITIKGSKGVRTIVVDEPSVVAVQIDKQGRNKILAVGKEAKNMLGKTPESIRAVRPMRDGVISDFDMTEKMIRYFIEKIHRRKTFLRPRIVICVPYGLTQVERKAVKESAMSAGAREVVLIEEPMAAAIGADLPVQEPKGSLVVDIGGGTTEIGVVSLGGLVISKSIRVAGDKIDIAIVDYLKRKYNLLIGERIAEDIKIKIGNAVAPLKKMTMQVKGRDQISGLLHTIEITSDEIREAIVDPLKEMLTTLKDVLEKTPPDLASDIVDDGVVITGGGALLRGIDKYFAKAIKLPVYIAENPLLAVAKGTGKVLEETKILKQLADG